MSTRWHSPLTESRPPARPRAYSDWVTVTVRLSLLVFWVIVVFLAWRAL